MPRCIGSSSLTPDEADKRYEERFGEFCRPAVELVRCTMSELADQFAEHQRLRCKAGAIAARTLGDYRDACRFVADAVGSRQAARLGKPDLLLLASRMSAFSPVRRQKLLVLIRAMLRWAVAREIMAAMPDLSELRPPKRSEFRRVRASRGRRYYEPAEIRLLLAKASPQFKAMVLLALNGGFGNTDLATIPRSAVDLDGAMVVYPRTKTGVERRVPLWPETVAAIAALPTFRSGRLFERSGGLPWVRLYAASSSDKLAIGFAELCEAAGVENRGFYSLRRTFRTAADAQGDQRAIALIMGHEVADMGGVYVQHITDERLRLVVASVRKQLGISLM